MDVAFQRRKVVKLLLAVVLIPTVLVLVPLTLYHTSFSRGSGSCRKCFVHKTFQNITCFGYSLVNNETLRFVGAQPLIEKQKHCRHLWSGGA